jgi:YHS domain-containing protein/predicted acylesterase/phospholipase RssA
VSVLPVDVAAMADPDVVLAVEVGAPRARRLPWLARAGWKLGRMLPNPFTAKSSFEILVRAAEIALDRQNTLAAAMVGPEVLVRVDVGDIGLRDFHRLEDAVAAGRRAMESALPALRVALESRPSAREALRHRALVLQFDPVCDMVVNPDRAVASVELDGRTIYFCSTSCRDTFARAAGIGRVDAKAQ